MTETNLHSARRQQLLQLLKEDDGVLQVTSALLSLPAPMRAFLAIVLQQGWNNLAITNISAAGPNVPINSVTIAGTLEKLRVSIVVSGDNSDMEAAGKPSQTVGALFIGGDVTVAMGNFLDNLLFAGFRLRRQERENTNWHAFQLGQRPSATIETTKLPTRDHGYLSLLLGQSEDRAMQVQIAWGDGQSRLMLPASCKGCG